MITKGAIWHCDRCHVEIFTWMDEQTGAVPAPEGWIDVAGKDLCKGCAEGLYTYLGTTQDGQNIEWWGRKNDDG